MKAALGKSVLWFRTGAVLMLLFAAGHTYGFLAFRPRTAEGQAVWTAMNSVRFGEGGSTYSYGQFYIGFGLFITLFLLFGAWLAWRLGSMSPSEARPITWVMFGVQCISLGLSMRYFAAGPAVLSAATALAFLLGGASAARPAAVAPA